MWCAFRSYRWLPVFLVTTVLASGCVRGLGQGTREPNQPVLITVKNNDFRDAVLFAVWEGRSPRRVGMVTGKTEQTFTVQWVGSTVVFEAHLIAGETVKFDRMDAWRGDHFELVILDQG